MSVGFILGPSGSGKSTYIEDHIIKQSKDDPTHKQLLIVPDQFNMQTQLHLIEKHPDHAFSNIEVLSFSRLSHRILEEVGGEDIPVLDDTGKNLIIRHVAQTVRGELDVMGLGIDKPGYISEIKSALSEFLQYGYKPEDVFSLAGRIEGRPSLARKIHDLGVIFREFMKYKEDHFITREETLGLVCESLHKSEMIRNSYMYFDGFTGFTPIQENVIGALMRYALNITFSFTVGRESDTDRTPGEEDLFYLPLRAVDRIRKLAEDNRILCDEPCICVRETDNRMLAGLEKNLFRYPYSPSEINDGSILIYKAADIHEEIRDTFSRVWDLIGEKGYKYSDIAIVTGDLASYADECRKIAGQFDIPVYLDYSRNIMSTNYAEFIISAYDVIRSDYTAESVIRHMRTLMGPLDRDETDELENFLLRTGIRGLSMYNRVWTLKAWEKDSTEGTRKSPEADFRHEESFHRINSIREKVATHFASLHNTKQSQVRNLYDFLENAGIYEKLQVMSTWYKEQGEISSGLEYEQIYDKTMELLDQIESLCGDEITDIDEFAGVLEAGLGEIKVGVIPQERDQVIIGDIIRTRLMNVKALFLLGVNDCNIPGKVSSGGIISDVDREYLTGLGDVQLAPSPREQMFTQRMYLYMNMTKPSEHLFISYVVCDSGGKDMQPSYLIGNMLRLFPQLTSLRSESTHSLEGMTMPVNLSRIRVTCSAFLRRYYEGDLDEKGIGFLSALCRTLVIRETGDLLLTMDRMTSLHFKDTYLPHELAEAIYGKTMQASVSRLERFCQCAYANFLNYGLIIRERPEYSFERRDLGNVYHKALEEFTDRLKREGMQWDGLTDEDADSWVDEIVEGIITTYSDTILLSSQRNIALGNRIRKVIRRSVDTIRYQVTQGEFIPMYFEKAFSDKRSARLEDGRRYEYRLVGKIDRMDICKKDNSRYLRVVDYKSGNKDMSLSGLYYGFMLQLPVYLGQAIRAQKDAYPSGMLYYHIFNPTLEVKSEINLSQAHNELLKSMKMKGIVDSDAEVLRLMDKKLCPGSSSDIIPAALKKDAGVDSRSKAVDLEDLRLICEYALDKADQTVKDMVGGNISAVPATWGKNKLPCIYCDYADICRIHSGIDGYGARVYDALSDKEALEAIRRAGVSGDRGNSTDMEEIRKKGEE